MTREIVSGLGLLGEQYARQVTHARLLEDQLIETRDLLNAYLDEQHPGALEFLRGIADDNRKAFQERRAAGKSIVEAVPCS